MRTTEGSRGDVGGPADVDLDALDRLGDLRELDPGDMTGKILGLAGQLEDALAAVQAADLDRVARRTRSARPDVIAVAGLGGSAVGADCVRALVEDELACPLLVVRDYDLPACVTGSSLVVLSSYSGNTEETISAYRSATTKGATCVCVTSGGELMRMAAENGHTVIRLPEGMPPRSAVGYSLVAVMGVLEKTGLVGGELATVREAADVLAGLSEVLGPRSSTDVNISKQIARKLVGRVPLVYGTGSWRNVAAMRWKTQINENAKYPAFWGAIPEVDHNEIVGWDASPSLGSQVELVLLRDRAETAQMKRRVEATRDLVSPRLSGVTEVWSLGRSKLARLLSLIYVGDFVSLYLSFLLRVDPTPVEAIGRLKAKLS